MPFVPLWCASIDPSFPGGSDNWLVRADRQESLLLHLAILVHGAVGVDGGVDGAGGEDLGDDLIGDWGVVAEVLLGVLAALADPEVAVIEPRARLLDDLVGKGQVDQV